MKRREETVGASLRDGNTEVASEPRPQRGKHPQVDAAGTLFRRYRENRIGLLTIHAKIVCPVRKKRRSAVS